MKQISSYSRRIWNMSGCPVCKAKVEDVKNKYEDAARKEEGKEDKARHWHISYSIWCHEGKAYCPEHVGAAMDKLESGFNPQWLFHYAKAAELTWKISNPGEDVSSVQMTQRRAYGHWNKKVLGGGLVPLLLLAMTSDWHIKQDKEFARYWKPILPWITQEKMHLLLVQLRKWREGRVREKKRLKKGKSQIPKVENGGRLYPLKKADYYKWFSGRVEARLRGLATVERHEEDRYHYQSYDVQGDMKRTDHGMRMTVSFKRHKDIKEDKDE